METESEKQHVTLPSTTLVMSYWFVKEKGQELYIRSHVIFIICLRYLEPILHLGDSYSLVWI